jgi:RNA polymerase sigma-B factor
MPTSVAPRPTHVTGANARAASPSPRAETSSPDDRRFAEYRSTGDRSIRNAIVEDHRWIAAHCVRRFVRKGVSTEDLFQVAMLGLVAAVDRFDPDLGYRFSTFAVPTVTGELRRHLRDHGWIVGVRRGAKENYLRVKHVAEDLEQVIGRSPTIPEIAQHAGLGIDDTLEAVHVGGVYRGVSLDAGGQDDGDDHWSDSGRFAVEERGFAVSEARAMLPKVLASLSSERDRLIVKLRFVDEMSQSRIAAEVGLSQIQVSRILRANLQRMRAQLTRAPRDGRPEMPTACPSSTPATRV